MINADIINNSTLLKTIRHDAHTELWMRYSCLSPRIRKRLEPASEKTKTLYHRHDTSAAFSLLTLITAAAFSLTAFFFSSTHLLVAAIISFFIFTTIEFRKKKILLTLCTEMLNILFADHPPKGTLFEFGEELARRYDITSFIDFSLKIDTLLKRIFLALYVAAGFICYNTNWTVWAAILILSVVWPFFLRPPKILRACLGLN